MNYISLDIKTAKGQATLKQEERAIQIYEDLNPHGHKFVETKKDSPAVVDGFLLKNNIIVGVVESKCRNMRYRELFENYGGDWLVTEEKINRARHLATELCVPLYGFLYLVPNDRLLVKMICDDRGYLTAPYRVEASETQRTVNGGTIIRNNAYINMENSDSYRYNS